MLVPFLLSSMYIFSFLIGYGDKLLVISTLKILLIPCNFIHNCEPSKRALPRLISMWTISFYYVIFLFKMEEKQWGFLLHEYKNLLLLWNRVGVGWRGEDHDRIVHKTLCNRISLPHCNISILNQTLPRPGTGLLTFRKWKSDYRQVNG